MDRERLGEDLRKLDVALTRARHALWIGAAPLAEVERSALGYLLGGGRPLGESLARLANGCAAIDVRPAPAPQDTPYQSGAARAQAAAAPPLPSGPRERWWIASYSALRRAQAGMQEDDGVEAAPADGAPASAAEDIYADSGTISRAAPAPAASCMACSSGPAARASHAWPPASRRRPNSRH
jgi:exodeoxyribonuclease V beta subunit